MKTILLLALAGAPAHAQVLRAPALSKPLLTVPLASPVLAAPRLAPALAAPSLAAPVVFLAPAQARAAVPVAAQPLAASVAAIAAARGDAAQAAPVLDRLFEGDRPQGLGGGTPSAYASVGRHQGLGGGTPSAYASVALPEAVTVSRPTLASPVSNAVRAAEPPAPKDPAWKRVGRVLGRTAGFAFGLWGGLKAGDLAYGLVLGGTGAVGLVLSAAALAGAAWLLRRREASLGSRLTWGAMLASGTFTIVGQLLWDVTGLPLVGLGAGLVLGAALALYGGGLGRR